LAKAEGDVHSCIQEASRILGHVTQELGVVLTPWLSWGILDRVEFVELSDNKVLVIVRVRSRLVKTVVLETQSSPSLNDLRQAAQDLNERLSGLTLEQIRKSLNERLPIEVKSKPLISVLLARASEIFDFSEPLEVHTCGTQHVLMQPEFSDSGMMERILTLIDDRRKLISLFNKDSDDTNISIGKENTDSRMRPFTVISTTYKRGKDIGTLGVIGPTRLQYGKVLPLVEYVSKVMSDYLS
jgi:heat-inducible transcriptional repressor